jgi:hypothetical protein
LIETSNGEFIVHCEWPSPTQQQNQNHTISIWGSANVKRNLEDGSLGFSVYCKRRSPKSPLFLPDLSPKAEDPLLVADTGNATITVSPKRAKWVEFGMSNMETKHKFGARETYSISNPISITTTPSWPWRTTGTKFRWPWMPVANVAANPIKLTYSRYGEGPPFYAPGRMCMLELQAEPINSIQDASPILQRLLNERVQGWDAPQFGQERVCLIPADDDTQDPLRIYKGYAIKAWEKARSVSSVVSFFRKERGFWKTTH